MKEYSYRRQKLDMKCLMPECDETENLTFLCCIDNKDVYYCPDHKPITKGVAC